MKKRWIQILFVVALSGMLITGCGKKQEEPVVPETEDDGQISKELEDEIEKAKEKAINEKNQEAADKVAKLIDEIYVQEWTNETDDKCRTAKAEWDKLTDEQKALVKGKHATPDYFGLDTGDAEEDDARCADKIKYDEILVVSFGTSYNDSRVNDIKSIEDAMEKAYPEWSVRRAFTSQIIINHIYARDGEKIDNVEMALARASANYVKNIVIQPTHLMKGSEYDELMETVKEYEGKFEKIVVAEPLLGDLEVADKKDDKKDSKKDDKKNDKKDKEKESSKNASDKANDSATEVAEEVAVPMAENEEGVEMLMTEVSPEATESESDVEENEAEGESESEEKIEDESEDSEKTDDEDKKDDEEDSEAEEEEVEESVSSDKEAVAKAVMEATLATAKFKTQKEADSAKVAIVFLGHGTSHDAKVTYTQMQDQMKALGYKNAFIGTVEGEPEGTSCEELIEKISKAGYKKVILRPLMVVAGDHANNDMAGKDDDSWKSQFEASKKFDKVDVQLEGLGSIEAIQKLYIAHTGKAMREGGIFKVSSVDSDSDSSGTTVHVEREKKDDKKPSGETGSSSSSGSSSGKKTDDKSNDSSDGKKDTTEKKETKKNGPGSYWAKFNSGSEALKINQAFEGKGALLIRADGSMVIHISLTNQNVTNMYVGSAEEAVNGGNLISPTVDVVKQADGSEQTVNGFEIPVAALDKGFTVSYVVEDGTWSEQTVTVSIVDIMD